MGAVCTVSVYGGLANKPRRRLLASVATIWARRPASAGRLDVLSEHYSCRHRPRHRDFGYDPQGGPYCTNVDNRTGRFGSHCTRGRCTAYLPYPGYEPHVACMAIRDSGTASPAWIFSRQFCAAMVATIGSSCQRSSIIHPLILSTPNNTARPVSRRRRSMVAAGHAIRSHDIENP